MLVAGWTTAPPAAVNDEMNRSRASGAPEDFAGGAPEGVSAGTWSRMGEQKMTCCAGCSMSIAQAQRQPFADIFFRLEDSRSEGQTKVRLIVYQADFGVNNCCTGKCSSRDQSCDKNCKTVFIYKMTIEVRPRSWGAQDTRCVQLQPYHTPEVFGIQRNSTLTIPMPLLFSKQPLLTYQSGNTVSRTALEFGWRTDRHAATNSLLWIWEFYRYANGAKLEFSKHRFGKRPPLGIQPSHMHVQPGSINALWELEPGAELLQHRLEWDVTVTLHTAIRQSKARLLGYSVTKGPTLSFEKLLAFS